jgi:hypothetical protein
MKMTIISLCIFGLSSQVSAAEELSAPLSVAVQTTYGFYSGSDERKSLLAEAVSAVYATEEFGASVAARNWKLTRVSTLGNLSGLDTNVSLYGREKLGTAGYVGGTVALNYLTSDDSNTNRKFVPYGAISCLTPDGGQYVDFGFAHSEYADTNVNQYSATFGISFFDRYLWSQARLYYNNLSSTVQGKGHTFAMEEQLTWFALPGKVSLTLSGRIGQSIYGYNQDSGIAYTMPDIQKESGGLTATWNITPSLRMLGDVVYERYEKSSISNSYGATYSTLGLAYKF